MEQQSSNLSNTVQSRVRKKMSGRRCKKKKINKNDRPAGRASQQNCEEEN